MTVEQKYNEIERIIREFDYTVSCDITDEMDLFWNSTESEKSDCLLQIIKLVKNEN